MKGMMLASSTTKKEGVPRQAATIRNMSSGPLIIQPQKVAVVRQPPLSKKTLTMGGTQQNFHPSGMPPQSPPYASQQSAKRENLAPVAVFSSQSDAQFQQNIHQIKQQMGKIPYFGPRGQTSASNRRIAEEKNFKIINGMFKSKQQSSSYNKQPSPQKERNEILMENHHGTPLAQTQKQNFQDYFQDAGISVKGRNSDPVANHIDPQMLQQPPHYFHEIPKPYPYNQPISKGIHSSHIRTEVNTRPIKIKNTQGLQGSIYSSSAASSQEGEHNIVLLNDSEGNELAQQYWRDLGEHKKVQRVLSNQQSTQDTSPKFDIQQFFIQRKISQNADRNAEEMSTASPNMQADNGTGQRKIMKFGNPGVPTLSIHKLNLAGTQQLQNPFMSLESNEADQSQRKGRRQIISKNKIRFVKDQQSDLKCAEEMKHTSEQPQGTQRRKVNQLKEAMEQANNYDKQGVSNAICQQQFELADKEEENCFNDLCDALQEFF